MKLSEIQERAKFDSVRYANCWEDAEILVDALQVRDKLCLSIGSAGDNSLALLAAGARHVHIVEMNPSQLACIHLRVAAYQVLSHKEFLRLHGELEAKPEMRVELYERCIAQLPAEAQEYWQAQLHCIERGFGKNGKFEYYFKLFREKVIPWIHSRSTIDKLLSLNSLETLGDFYDKKWNNLRWRLLFKVFFSRFMMGRLGRDPAFFKYVEGSVADRILERTKHALTEIIPNTNPYLHHILKGCYGNTLPLALREEHFDTIASRIQNITIHDGPIEQILPSLDEKVDAFNLSDIFEYMSEDNTKKLAECIAKSSNKDARLAYWNMLAPRSCAQLLPDLMISDKELSKKLFVRDKAFFYSAFHVDKII
jgi:S-adenosylmethionine-diacylglycerol 3-amino-3-carboxypropyl transferase